MTRIKILYYLAIVKVAFVSLAYYNKKNGKNLIADESDGPVVRVRPRHARNVARPAAPRRRLAYSMGIACHQPIEEPFPQLLSAYVWFVP